MNSPLEWFVHTTNRVIDLILSFVVIERKLGSIVQDASLRTIAHSE